MRSLAQTEFVALNRVIAQTKDDSDKEGHMVAMMEGLDDPAIAAALTKAPDVVEEDDYRLRILVILGDTGWFIETDPTIAVIFDVHRFKRF